MKILIFTLLTTIALDAHALNFFARRARRQPIGTRAAVINDSVFTLHNGRLYRSDHRDGPPKSFARRPHLEKIARFGDLLAGLTYGGNLVFWREVAGVWQIVEGAEDARDVVDFSANQNKLVAVRRDGYVDQWSSISSKRPVPGPRTIIGVEGYAAEVGFGLIRADQSKIYLVPSRLKCDQLLVEIPR